MYKLTVPDFSIRDICLCAGVGILNLAVAVLCFTAFFSPIIVFNIDLIIPLGFINATLALLNILTALVAFFVLDHKSVIAGNLDA